MVEPGEFFEALKGAGVRLIVGVPDSLLQDFCRHVDAVMPADRHVVTANEGSAIALAAGFHLATGSVPLVYLQNSGLGNAVNPLLSLVDPEVYAIPVVLVVGWRGEPDVPDEPQHRKQGRVTPVLLDAMEIPYRRLRADEPSPLELAGWAVAEARRRRGPVALLVHRGAFAPADVASPTAAAEPLPLSREEAIACIVETLAPDSAIVATTGMIGRELHALRLRAGHATDRDFLTVGSMGHASQIALGIAMAGTDRPVVCLDGDGATLMHLGGLATIGTSCARHLLHVVLNNGAHDSVGGQATAAFAVDLAAVARACGYRVSIGGVRERVDLVRAVADLQATPGPVFLEVRVRKGARAGLGRPAASTASSRSSFMRWLRAESEG